MDSEKFSLTAQEKIVAAKFFALEQDEDHCRLLWERLDRARKQLAKTAGLGRKRQLLVRISETHDLKIVNQFRGVDKVFTPAFCRRLEISKVKHVG